LKTSYLVMSRLSPSLLVTLSALGFCFYLAFIAYHDSKSADSIKKWMFQSDYPIHIDFNSKPLAEHFFSVQSLDFNSTAPPFPPRLSLPDPLHFSLNLGFFIDFCVMMGGYSSFYIVFCLLYEFCHPDCLSSARRPQIFLEIQMSFNCLFWSMLYSVVLIRYILPSLWTADYYLTHDFTVSKFFFCAFFYFFFNDTLTYFHHRAFHHPFFWNLFHGAHHDFRHATAFAQMADHPVEILIVATEHFAPLLFIPIPPPCHFVFGVISAVLSIAAHDSREGDYLNHAAHHLLVNVNYAGFFPFWDWVCGTNATAVHKNIQNHSKISYATGVPRGKKLIKSTD